MNYLKTFLPYLFGNKQGKSYKLPPDEDVSWGSLNFEETLMFHTLKNTLDQFISTLTLETLTTQQALQLFNFENYLPTDFFNKLSSHFENDLDLFRKAKRSGPLNAHDLQEILNYKNHALSIFVLLNSDRTKPGRLFIRSPKGHFIHQKDGSVWSIKVLGVSSRGLPFNHSNGSTPVGVYSVDSVMPEANKNFEFGKFRRLIVNFLKKSPSEENIKQFLPRTHQARTWWIPCIVGRELGRSLLRIHGTGRINKNPFNSYFPMIPSSGCLTTTERDFMGVVKINDQRLLLDTLMETLNLPVTFENESKIHGVLYVVEFDGTYQALEFRGQ